MVLEETTTRIGEGETAQLQTTFKDEAGTTITSVDSCSLTLYDLETLAIINSRDGVNVLSDVSEGVLTFKLTAADNVIVNGDGREFERHIVLLEYAEGTTVGKKEISILVRALDKVP